MPRTRSASAQCFSPRFMPRFALGLCFALAGAASAHEQLLDGIAAQVGSEIVLISEVMQVAGPALDQAQAAGAQPAELQAIRDQALDRAIERALIRQVVRRAELDAGDTEVDDAIGNIAAENEISVPQLRQSVESQGMPYEIYRERIRAEIEHSKVMNGIVASRVRVGEEEVRKRYQAEFGKQPRGGEEFFLRHLLFSFAARGGDRKAARAAAGAARARIAAGEDAAAVAAEVSEANPERGGALGWIHRRDLAGWMAPAVLPLESGALSEVIETSFGCNLVQVVERREYQPVTFERAEDALHGRIFAERMQVEYVKFIDEIRADTYIERKPFFADAQAAEAAQPAQAESEVAAEAEAGAESESGAEAESEAAVQAQDAAAPDGGDG